MQITGLFLNYLFYGPTQSVWDSISKGCYMFEKHFLLYRAVHQHFINKVAHFIGIPCLFFSIFILTNWLEISIHGFASLPITWLIILGLTVFYCFFDWQLALVTGAWLLLLGVIAFFSTGITPSLKGFYIFLIFFLLAWIFQGIGHCFERRLPVLFKKPWQSLHAPFFITTECALFFAWKRPLCQHIQIIMEKRGT